MESVMPGGMSGILDGGGSLGLPSPSTPTPDAPTSPNLPLGF